MRGLDGHELHSDSSSLAIPPRLPDSRTSSNADFLTPIYSQGMFSDVDCDTLLAAWAGATSASADVTGEYELTRRGRVSTLDLKISSEQVRDALVRVAIACRDAFNFDVDGIDRNVSLLTYEKTDFFNWHADAGMGNFRHRKLVVSIQLSSETDYDGGDLEFFPRDSRRSRRARGTVTCFSPFVIHRVTPVTRGQRKAAVFWLTGPPFR